MVRKLPVHARVTLRKIGCVNQGRVALEDAQVQCRNLVVLSLGLAMTAVPAAADLSKTQLDLKLPRQGSEVVGAAAAGAPRPYRASVFDFVGCDLEARQCVLTLNKKKKNRTIDWLTCFMTADNQTVDVGFVAFDVLDEQNAETVAVMAVKSRVENEISETTVLEFRGPLTVPAGRELNVLYSFASDIPDVGALGCMVGGTIE
jgi:hypothetical protein